MVALARWSSGTGLTLYRGALIPRCRYVSVAFVEIDPKSRPTTPQGHGQHRLTRHTPSLEMVRTQVHIMRVEHEYERMGALLAALDVHTGKVIADTPPTTGITPFRP